VHLMFHERTKWIVYAGAVASALLQDSHAAIKVSRVKFTGFIVAR